MRPSTPPQGLIGFLSECLLVSCAISGVRRTVGLNVYEAWLKPNIGSVPIRTGIRAYLNLGEITVDKGIELYDSKIRGRVPPPTRVDLGENVDDQRGGRFRY